MNESIKRIVLRLLPLMDVLIVPAVYVAGWLLKLVRSAGVERMPRARATLRRVGVFPIRNHYYEPLFDPRDLRKPLDQERALPGIDWNVDEQLRLLGTFRYHDELPELQAPQPGLPPFRFGAVPFDSGDAEYLYSFVRARKPARIIEIGSGHSTIVASMAVRRNRLEDGAYECTHLCIEPYEAPWLERTGATVLRQRVEDVDLSLFSALRSNDLLFIDSSHILRPQGDVTFEYLQVLPSLNVGVAVHVHDIFSPRDYPREWVVDSVRLWNEQYVLEAFLSCNRQWKVVAALNYLHHRHYDALRAACPFLTPDREPGSFYIERIAA